MYLEQIFDKSLAQYAYLIGCQRTGEAIVIDPQRDIDRYIKIAEENDLKITAVTETHIHADFVSGSREFVETQPSVTAYLSNEGDENWKYQWAKGNDRVKLIHHGDQFKIGNITLAVLHSPGHTPEHVCFVITDNGGGADLPIAIASGDFIFVGDVGRPDLLETAAGVAGAREPSARTLYQSLLKFTELPDFLQVLPGHGAGSACGKALGAIPSSTVGYEKRFNHAITTAVNRGEEEFVKDILSGQPEPPMYFARMKVVNKVGPAILGGIPDPDQIDAHALVAASKKESAVVIDVSKKRGEFMDAHLRGSLYATMDRLSVTAGSYVDPGETIYLLLENEEQLDAAVRDLIRIGYDRIGGYAIYSDVKGHLEYKNACLSTMRCLTTDIDQLAREYDESVVLDVRSIGEFEEGHVPGAVNIAYTRLADRHEQLPLRKLLVYCRSGNRAALAVPYLERIGLDPVYCDGNFSDWESYRETGVLPHHIKVAKSEGNFAI